jgi:hypothetical protein
MGGSKLVSPIRLALLTREGGPLATSVRSHFGRQTLWRGSVCESFDGKPCPGTPHVEVFVIRPSQLAYAVAARHIEGKCFSFHAFESA